MVFLFIFAECSTFAFDFYTDGSDFLRAKYLSSYYKVVKFFDLRYVVHTKAEGA